jgi:S1-C subfamily serine protease
MSVLRQTLARGLVAGLITALPALLSLPGTDVSAQPNSPPPSTPAAPASRVSSGTGFFVSPDGLLVTAAHVVRNRDRVMVFLDGRLIRASVVREDPPHDLALLRIERSPVPYLVLGRSDNVPVGLEIYTIGFPQLRNLRKSHPRFANGILSAEADLNENTAYFQFSAPTQSGNSGSPLMGADLSVIGIVLSKLRVRDTDLSRGDVPQNVNFALKASYITALLQETGSNAPPARSIDPRSDRRPYEVFQDAWRAVVPIVATNGEPGTGPSEQRPAN